MKSKGFLISVVTLLFIGIGAKWVMDHPSWFMQLTVPQGPIRVDEQAQQSVSSNGMPPVLVKKNAHDRGLNPADILPQPENELVFYNSTGKEIWRESIEYESGEQSVRRPTWSQISNGEIKIELKEDPNAIYKLQVQFKTSVIMSGSNEHTIMLQNYKHGQSQWLDLPKSISGEYLLTYEEQDVPNIAINPDEISNELKLIEEKAGGETFGDPRWELTTVSIKILKHESGQWTEIRQVDFEDPWSC